MKLQKPLVESILQEERYLTHCANIANILANNQGSYAQEQIKKYIEITGAELQGPSVKSQVFSEQKYCPKCDSVVEFAQDPLRICGVCGWTGDYTKLVER